MFLTTYIYYTFLSYLETLLPPVDYCFVAGGSNYNLYYINSKKYTDLAHPLHYNILCFMLCLNFVSHTDLVVWCIFHA